MLLFYSFAWCVAFIAAGISIMLFYFVRLVLFMFKCGTYKMLFIFNISLSIHVSHTYLESLSIKFGTWCSMLAPSIVFMWFKFSPLQFSYYWGLMVQSNSFQFPYVRYLFIYLMVFWLTSCVVIVYVVKLNLIRALLDNTVVSGLVYCTVCVFTTVDSHLISRWAMTEHYMLFVCLYSCYTSAF